MRRRAGAAAAAASSVEWGEVDRDTLFLAVRGERDRERRTPSLPLQGDFGLKTRRKSPAFTQQTSLLPGSFIECGRGGATSSQGRTCSVGAPESSSVTVHPRTG